jgi:hypothetical protein
MYFLASFLNSVSAWTIALALLIGLTIFYLLGTKLGDYQKKHHPEAKGEGIGPLEGSLLGLLALILSFTFSMAASRFDARRAVVIEEANHISTAILRSDMYPDSIRTSLRKDFQQYVEARISYYEAGRSEEKINRALAATAQISDRIWQRAIGFYQTSATTLPHNLMVPELNDMIDIVTTREALRHATVPDSIAWLLIILSLLGSSIIGYSKTAKKNDWIILTIYSLMTVFTVYTIIDLDRPRQGFIKTDVENKKIIELRNLFAEQGR